MIETLAIIGGIGTTGALVAVIVLALKLAAAKDDQIATLDLLDDERTRARQLEEDLRLEIGAHEVTQGELDKERYLRAEAEASRNECVRRDRENTVKLIEGSGIADAVSIGNRILSAPLPGARLSETGDTALEKP